MMSLNFILKSNSIQYMTDLSFKKSNGGKNSNILLQQQHPYHLVDPSPWPLVTSISALGLTTGTVMYMHANIGGGFLSFFSFVMLLVSMILWWRDVIREATFEGHHTAAVQQGLRYGMILFIASEVMFFLAFFWGFFHASLAPSIEIGAVWPPKGITPFNAWDIPFLNTLILLLSGATVTWAHHAIVGGDRHGAIYGLISTVLLGLIFSTLQGYEYLSASFTIADGVYGSVFYMATGFHGFHVLIGTIFLLVCLIRQISYHFSTTHHFGLEAAAWYWHFVDVVWLFLFISIYWWGS
jgi:heme/copper-type cytochrome/quinol oxidase subunit 3